MSIKKELILECKGYQEGIINKFEYVDDNRKVDIYTTHYIICKIKKRLEFYSKSTNEEIKSYLFFWNKWIKFDLVPDGTNIDLKSATYQYFVKKNYEFLEDGKLLNHNQALFLLLGLNAYALGKTIKNFPKLGCDEEPFHPAEMELWRTDQNQALLLSNLFESNGKITSENLKKLANKNNFFTKPKPTNKKTENKEKRKEIVKTALVDFLGQAGFKHKYTINSLTQKAGFIKALKEHEPNNLIISVTGEDANKKTRKSNEITPRQLGVYLAEIFKCKDGDNWWTEQDKSIQDKVKLPKK